MFILNDSTVWMVLGSSWCQPGMAYVDPVNGAMLLQVIASGVLGIAILCRRIIVNGFRNLRARLARLFK